VKHDAKCPQDERDVRTQVYTRRLPGRLPVEVTQLRCAHCGAVDKTVKHPDRRGAYPELTDAERLRELYIDEGLSTRRIARRIGCTDRAVYNALRRHGIPTRPQPEHLRRTWEPGAPAALTPRAARA
jgi:DNA-binding CsgD family transcriptional regulator